MWHLFLTAFIHVFSQESQWTSQIENIYTRMRSENQINQIEAKKTESTDLSVLTINLGLLNLPVVKVPYYKDRAKLLSPIIRDFIVSKWPGVLFIQELWHENDFNALNELALSLDYIPVIYDYDNIAKRGLQILIDREITQEESVEGEFLEYTGTKGPIKAWYEELFGNERGLLYAKITLDDGKKILLGNTHLTSGIDEVDTRKKQLQSLIHHLKSGRRFVDYIILGGDFNFSPDLNKDEPNIDKWYDNQYLYIYFNTEMKKNGLYLLDTYRTVRNNMGFTQDRKNSVAAISSSTKNEPEQRLNFIWACPTQKNNDKNLAVISSDLIFNRPVSSKNPQGENIKIFLSDHFGVMSVLSLFDKDI